MPGQDKVRTPEVEQLLTALRSLNDNDELYALLVDLATFREIQEMSQRLEVARLLSAGELYMSIQKITGASATTVARVSKCLNYGEGGYETVLSRIAE
ncbi:MAG: TrpR YerC/YecD [Coriobacteriia bacterium]|nr:TrpR YerC/YecD [Coriobacteriia bacterium]